MFMMMMMMTMKIIMMMKIMMNDEAYDNYMMKVPQITTISKF